MTLQELQEQVEKLSQKLQESQHKNNQLQQAGQTSAAKTYLNPASQTQNLKRQIDQLTRNLEQSQREKTEKQNQAINSAGGHTWLITILLAFFTFTFGMMIMFAILDIF